MSDSEIIRILIVDDHALVRLGLRHYLYGFDWLKTVGEAENGAQAVDFCAKHDVDVVLMDMMMPVMNGSEATRRIIELGKPVKIIILTSFHEQELVEDALKAGATSYLLKNVTSEELATAIRYAHAGRATLAQEATDALIAVTRQRPEVGFDLTDRELATLTLVARGLSNPEVADELAISVRTVTFHLSNIFTKLDAKNRVEAVTIALEHHLVDVPD
jgi:NarL family two-component system response regulator LiaR